MLHDSRVGLVVLVSQFDQQLPVFPGVVLPAPPRIVVRVMKGAAGVVVHVLAVDEDPGGERRCHLSYPPPKKTPPVRPKADGGEDNYA